MDAGEALADLVLVVDAATCAGDVDVTVTNSGSEDANNVVVRVFGGDPSAGGMALGEATIGSLPAGMSLMLGIDIGARTRDVTIWAVADPNDQIEECNDANNVVQGPALKCNSEPH